MTKQDILFALAVTHPEGAPVTPGASWETLSELAEIWTGDTTPPSLSALNAALTTYRQREQARVAESTARTAKKTALFLDLKTRLATDLGIQVETPADLAGRIEQVIPAARLKRDAKATLAERVTEMERQVEILTMFVALLSRS